MGSEWKQKLFVGVEIPLPWLVGIVALLLFNAGILYSQFDDLKMLTKATAARIDGIERRVDTGDARDLRTSDRQSFSDGRIDDHERRLRDVERKMK